MTKGRFIIFLVIVFAATFLWSGGTSLLSSFTTPVSVKDIHSQMDMVSEKAKELPGLWDRFYRVAALKTAVEKKLNPKTAVPLSRIPLIMQQAIISVEDNRFYRHVGFDIEGIIRATLVNMQSGELVEGGSTITQQLVKNMFLTHERSMGRKIEELILSVDMELRYSKEEILEMYLNHIYFGANAYGIGEAARIYFNKTPDKLTLGECALLAGLPNAPSLYSPYTDLKAARERQSVVLQTMVRNGYIGPSAAQEAKAAPLKLAR